MLSASEVNEINRRDLRGQPAPVDGPCNDDERRFVESALNVFRLFKRCSAGSTFDGAVSGFAGLSNGDLLRIRVKKSENATFIETNETQNLIAND